MFMFSLFAQKSPDSRGRDGAESFWTLSYEELRSRPYHPCRHRDRGHRQELRSSRGSR